MRMFMDAFLGNTVFFLGELQVTDEVIYNKSVLSLKKIQIKIKSYGILAQRR